MMDPVSVILTALLQGATAAAQEKVHAAVSGAYEHLIAYVRAKFKKVPIEQIEKDPADQETQSFAKSVMGGLDCGSDAKLIGLAEDLITSVGRFMPEVADKIGHHVAVTAERIEVKDNKGNVLIGAIVEGDVKYEIHQTSSRNARMDAFRTSPDYARFKAHSPKMNFPAIHMLPIVFFLLMSIFVAAILDPIYALAGVPIILFFVLRTLQHHKSPIQAVPTVVATKDESQSLIQVDLKLEDGSVRKVKASFYVEDRFTVDDIGMAYVTKKGILVDFKRFEERK